MTFSGGLTKRYKSSLGVHMTQAENNSYTSHAEFKPISTKHTVQRNPMHSVACTECKGGGL